MASRYIDAAEVAKLIRQTLKIEFPNVKFSVKTKKYSGGASVRVSWVDGPTTKAVDSVVKFYQGATFDSMIDLKEYVTMTNEAGEEIRYGSDWVFTERSFSVEHVRPFADYVAKHFHLTTLKGETVENVEYELLASKYGGDAYIPYIPVYFGRTDFAAKVFDLVHEYGSFADYQVQLEKEQKERDAWEAEYQAKQVMEEKWDNALETAIAKSEPEISDYEQMLIAAGWIAA